MLIRKQSNSIVRIVDYDILVSSEPLHHAPIPQGPLYGRFASPDKATFIPTGGSGIMY